MRHEEASSDHGAEAEISGVLELEGDCLFVTPTHGGRYPIVWPATTQWDEETRSIAMPSGETLSIGDRVYGSGAYLRVDQVEPIAGSEAAELARRCVDNASDQVAVTNNDVDAIGRS